MGVFKHPDRVWIDRPLVYVQTDSGHQIRVTGGADRASKSTGELVGINTLLASREATGHSGSRSEGRRSPRPLPDAFADGQYAA